MSDRLPPLNALRAFEAAARHLSFKAAAKELFVTPGAISQQVKRLEQELDVVLFHRLTRRIVLSDAGRAYFPLVHQAFGQIIEATDNLAPGRHTQTLTISMFPSLAVRWLVPRLGRFSRCHPDIEVRIRTSGHLVDFAAENVDMAIRHGRGRYPGLQVDLLATWDIWPVCSPRLLDGSTPLRGPDDLAGHTLLHDDEWRDWAAWLDAAGATAVNADRGPKFSDIGLILQAALEDQGVALSSPLLIADDLATERLVVPFGPALASTDAVYVVSPTAMIDVPKIVLFREWLQEEAAQSIAAFARWSPAT